MEPKPILLIKIHAEMAGTQNTTEIEDIIQKKCYDYHVFVVPTLDDDEPIIFETFFPKDFKEIDFEELKEIIRNK